MHAFLTFARLRVTWELIGGHHAGSITMPRLNGKPGTNSANEGIWIQAIIEAFGKHLDR
ncbi:MAG: hypothetical protein ABIQ88_09795 [Chitinophagaceae bacterium]